MYRLTLTLTLVSPVINSTHVECSIFEILAHTYINSKASGTRQKFLVQMEFHEDVLSQLPAICMYHLAWKLSILVLAHSYLRVLKRKIRISSRSTYMHSRRIRHLSLSSTRTAQHRVQTHLHLA